MPSPFPGIAPYIENPEFWSEVHHRLMVALAELFVEIADSLSPQLRPKYRVAIEKRRTYFNDNTASLLVGIANSAVLTNWAKALLREHSLRA